MPGRGGHPHLTSPRAPPRDPSLRVPRVAGVSPYGHGHAQWGPQVQEAQRPAQHGAGRARPRLHAQARPVGGGTSPAARPATPRGAAPANASVCTRVPSRGHLPCGTPLWRRQSTRKPHLSAEPQHGPGARLRRCCGLGTEGPQTAPWQLCCISSPQDTSSAHTSPREATGSLSGLVPTGAWSGASLPYAVLSTPTSARLPEARRCTCHPAAPRAAPGLGHASSELPWGTPLSHRRSFHCPPPPSRGRHLLGGRVLKHLSLELAGHPKPAMQRSQPGLPALPLASQ